MNTKLSFRDVHFNVVNRNCLVYLTSVEIAKALKYKILMLLRKFTKEIPMSFLVI